MIELLRTATPVGVLPNGALGKGWMPMVLTAWSATVSITDTLSLFVFATTRNRPNRVIPVG
jgi:hypothetical protein